MLVYTIRMEGRDLQEVIGAIKDTGATTILDVRSGVQGRLDRILGELIESMASGISYIHHPPFTSGTAGLSVTEITTLQEAVQEGLVVLFWDDNAESDSRRLVSDLVEQVYPGAVIKHL